MGWFSYTDPAPVLHPGEGAFLLVLSNGVRAPITLTFVGEIPRRPCRTIYAGANMWSPSLGGDISEIQPREGDTVFTYDMIGQVYRDAWAYIEGFGWLNPSDPDPRGPRIRTGESIFLLTQFTRNPCVIEGASASAIQSISSTTLMNPVRSGSTFSFEFASWPGYSYQVETTDTYPNPGPWNLRGAPMAGTGQTITYTDTTATGSSRYYRLLVQ